MTRRHTAAALREAGVVGVVRTASREEAVEAALLLLDAGLRAVEITMTTPDGIAALGEVVDHAPPDSLVGAGTVLSAEEATACVAAGARFLVSPATLPDVVAAGHASDVTVLPGALTPTEVLTASRLGVELVKLFPAHILGTTGLRSVLDPLPWVSFVPSGGIRVAEAGAWLRAGAAAVGLGRELTSGSPREVRDRVARLLAEVDEARRGGA